MAYALEIKDVHKVFNRGTINEKIALNGVNLTLNEGDFVTIIGGNGAGKSTLLNMIAGVYPIDNGKIEIDGINISIISFSPFNPYLPFGIYKRHPHEFTYGCLLWS